MCLYLFREKDKGKYMFT